MNNVIISFKDKLTKAIFGDEKVSKVEKKLLKKARIRLDLLDNAERLEDMYFPPSNKFHALEGFNPARFAIRVDRQWRISFEWDEENGNAHNVCFEDYH